MSSSSSRYSPLGRPAGLSHVVEHGPPVVCSVFLLITFVLSLLTPGGWFSSQDADTPAPPLSASPSSIHPGVQANTRGVAPLPRHLHNSLTLTQEQCKAEFPLLYPQLTDMKRTWGHRGIALEDVDRLEHAARSQDRWGWARVVIRDGRLWIRTLFSGQDTRLTALLAQLNEVVVTDAESAAVANGTTLPPIELVISSGDKEGFPGYESGPGWVLTKRIQSESAKGNWLAPDFGFKGWPEAQAPTYPEVVSLQRSVEQTYPWDRKDDRAFWRGFPNFYPIRKDLMDRTRTASHTDASSPNAWADIFATSFGGETGPEYRPLVKLEDHCTRKYLVHSEGNSYSGRSKYLLSCHAITIAHPMEWTQHFHPALISNPDDPAQNFIELRGPGFEGLEETVRGLWQTDTTDSKGTRQPPPSTTTHPGLNSWLQVAQRKYRTLGDNTARQIADNARDSLRDRYLTPAATTCYYKAALRTYALVSRYNTWPNAHDAQLRGPAPQPGNGLSKGKMLGSLGAQGDISYDSWVVINAKKDWPPREGP